MTPSLETRPSIMSPPKKKASAGKKFVASTGAAKRRPVLTRRTSSQSSVTPDQGPKEVGSSSSSRSSGTPQRPVSPIVEGLKQGATAATVQSPKSPRLSAKAAGKQPALPRRDVRERKVDGSHKLDQLRRQDSMPNYRASTATGKPRLEPRTDRNESTKRAQSLVNLSNHEQTGPASPGPGPFEAGASAVPMAPSRSHSGFIHRRESSVSGGASQGLFTGATSSTTNVAAQGMIIDQSGSVRPGNDLNLDDQRMRDTAAVSLSSSLLDTRFQPTLPSSSASVPLGRTKSQLTLLLEREKDARSGHKPFSRNGSGFGQ